LRELAQQAADAEWPNEEQKEIKVVLHPQEKAGILKGGADAVRKIIDGMRGWPQVLALLILTLGALAAFFISKL
jgi:hypothetical protein